MGLDPREQLLDLNLLREVGGDGHGFDAQSRHLVYRLDGLLLRTAVVDYQMAPLFSQRRRDGLTQPVSCPGDQRDSGPSAASFFETPCLLARPSSDRERHRCLADPLSRMPQVSHPIVDPTGQATNESSEEDAIEESQKSAGPGDRIPGQVVAQQAEMRPDGLSALKNEPHGRHKQPRSGQKAADDGQDTGSQARHSRADQNLFVDCASSRHDSPTLKGIEDLVDLQAATNRALGGAHQQVDQPWPSASRVRTRAPRPLRNR